MNERIRELWEQAKTSGVHPQFGEYDKYSAEKFAELIVRECMAQVEGQYLPVLEDEAMMKDTHWSGYVQCGVDSVVAIKEHFYGVEE